MVSPYFPTSPLYSPKPKESYKPRIPSVPMPPSAPPSPWFAQSLEIPPTPAPKPTFPTMPGYEPPFDISTSPAAPYPGMPRADIAGFERGARLDRELRPFFSTHPSVQGLGRSDLELLYSVLPKNVSTSPTGEQFYFVSEGEPIRLDQLVDYLASPQGMSWIKSLPIDKRVSLSRPGKVTQWSPAPDERGAMTMAPVVTYPNLGFPGWGDQSALARMPTAEEPYGSPPGQRGDGAPRGTIAGQYAPRTFAEAVAGGGGAGGAGYAPEMSRAAIEQIFEAALPMIPSQREFFQRMMSTVYNQFLRKGELGARAAGGEETPEHEAGWYDALSLYSEDEDRWASFLQDYPWYGEYMKGRSPKQRGEYARQFAPVTRWLNY